MAPFNAATSSYDPASSEEGINDFVLDDLMGLDDDTFEEIEEIENIFDNEDDENDQTVSAAVSVSSDTVCSTPITAPVVIKGSYLLYPDGIYKEVGERMNYLLCKYDEFRLMGLDDELFQRLNPEQMCHADLLRELVTALGGSQHIKKKVEDELLIYVLPPTAKRLDAVYKYYIGGHDLESSIRGETETSLDQGVWQRTLDVGDSDRDALITAQLARDWKLIAKFLQFYMKKQGDKKHWCEKVDDADGTVHVHFNKTYVASAVLASAAEYNVVIPISVEVHNTVFQYDGVSHQYENMSGASSPVTNGTHSDVEELHTNSECSSSSSDESEEEGEQAKGAQKSDFPGDRAPRGADLPDRGRHVCRMVGCSKIYRWPDYFCGDHGGGRCQYQHWVDGQAQCTRFHQSRNSRGELLCGAHSRMINACYGEEKRKPKGIKGIKVSKVKKTVTKAVKKTKGRAHTCA